MRDDRDAIPQGTLDMLILKVLARAGELHGFQIADSIQQTSEDVLCVEEGSLYPALQRMLIKGWIKGEWRKTEENRRARYYKLTSDGRKQLTQELERYQRVTHAIARIVQPVRRLTLCGDPGCAGWHTYFAEMTSRAIFRRKCVYTSSFARTRCG